MKNPILIFDFDGTIADTHHYICNISNKICEEFNYHAIDFEEIDKLKDMTARQVIQYLKVPLLKIPAIISRSKKEFKTGIDQLEPFEGIEMLLEQLKAWGIQMGILSSNSLDNIHHFLELHSLDFFTFIQNTPLVWTKNTSLKKIMQSKNYNPEQIIYIGDEVRDIEAAKKAGVKVGAVSWGYNSLKTLSDHNPDYIFKTPQDILDFFKASQS